MKKKSLQEIKNIRLEMRITPTHKKTLELLGEKMGLSYSDVVRQLIDKAAQQVKKPA